MKTFVREHPHISQGILLVPALIAVVMILARGFLLNRPEEYPVTELDSGWHVTRNGDPIDTGTLSQVITGNVHWAETFVLTRRLSDSDELPSACIFFRNLHSAVRVTMDGTELYSSGWEQYETGRMVGRSLCFVPLPGNHAGKELQITLTAAEENAFYGLGPVFYGVEQDLFTHFLRERQFAFYIALFFIFRISF